MVTCEAAMPRSRPRAAASAKPIFKGGNLALAFAPLALALLGACALAFAAVVLALAALAALVCRRAELSPAF